MKEMKTLTMPNGVTYEIVDDKARKDIANIDAANKRDLEEQIAQAVAEYMANNDIVAASPARIGTVSLLASKWVGSGNLHSQIVTVNVENSSNGVTKNSQVDLTPSVEQLVIFYEKDLTFVTENEGGVVTVYAIGQKPENDYTVQVTITEVNV